MSQNWIKEKKFCSTQQNSVWTELVVVFYIFGHFLPHQPPPPPNNKDLLFEGKWKWRNQKKKKTNTKFPKKNWFFLSLWMVIIIIIILHTDIVQLGIVDQNRTMNWMKRNKTTNEKEFQLRKKEILWEEKKNNDSKGNVNGEKKLFFLFQPNAKDILEWIQEYLRWWWWWQVCFWTGRKAIFYCWDSFFCLFFTSLQFVHLQYLDVWFFFVDSIRPKEKKEKRRRPKIDSNYKENRFNYSFFSLFVIYCNSFVIFLLLSFIFDR